MFARISGRAKARVSRHNAGYQLRSIASRSEGHLRRNDQGGTGLGREEKSRQLLTAELVGALPLLDVYLPLLRELGHVHGLTDRQGMSSFIPPPIPYGLFMKNSRLPSAASAY
jgi:hypothetical protein